MEYIKCLDDLLNIKRKGDYELACDIDCKGKKVKCLVGDFSGKLYGNGHKIMNLMLSDEIWGDEQTLALFFTMSQAEIVDIAFEKISVVYDNMCYEPKVAVLAGRCSNSTIRNVSVLLETAPEFLPLMYEVNDCEIENVSLIKDGKQGQIAKYC
ncbi:MAG: hypothetical protein IKD69_16600 [Solobacterium sp.]|nr:hypothetical protein [Solobacterium sp.]